jgi:hypothetical protein
MAIAFIASSAASASVTFTTGGAGVAPGATIPIGSTIVVGINAGSNILSSVTDSGGNAYVQKINDTVGDGNITIQIWVCASSTAQLTTGSTITGKTSSGTTTGAISIAAYSGVLAIGVLTAQNDSASATTTPTVSLTTQDANNFVVAILNQGSSTIQTWSAGTGNLRTSIGIATVRGQALVDNTAASATSVTCSATSNRSAGYGAVAIELLTVAVPVVTTQAETAITSYTGTGNGTVVALNAGNVTASGFVWDTASQALPGNVAPASSGYGFNLNTGNNFSTIPSSFSATMRTLPAGTTIFVRAWAQNSSGYAYGGEVSFTTLTVFTFSGLLF